MSKYEPKKLLCIKGVELKIINVLFLSALLSACSSTYHNKSRDGDSFGGGGFENYKYADGLFLLTASSNYTLTADYSDAQNTFDRRAGELCEGAYRTFDTEKMQKEFEHDYGALRKSKFEVSAFVICESSGLNDATVIKIVSQRLSLGTPPPPYKGH